MSVEDRPRGRRCAHCRKAIDITKKSGALFCSPLCKSRWHNRQRRATGKRLPAAERRESDFIRQSHSPGAVQFWLGIGAFRRRRPALRT